MSGSVLYDVPGPRAIARNRVIGVITVIVVIAIIGFFVWRLIATGQFSAEKWIGFTYTRIWEQIAMATLRTLAAFGAAAVGALILGFVLAIGRLSDRAWIRWPVTVVTEFMRAVPVLVMMFLLYYGLPVIGVDMPSYWAVVIALIAYNGSVLAEVIRAGVESLPRGQGEAGYSIGLRKSGVMRLILLPQAIRAMMPVIISQLVVTLKDTALGFIITYEELLLLAKQLGAANTIGRPIVQMTMVVAVIYIGMCLLLSLLAKVAEKRMSRSPKVQGAVQHLDADPRKHDGTDTELIAAQRGAGKFDGTSTGSGLGR